MISANTSFKLILGFAIVFASGCSSNSALDQRVSAKKDKNQAPDEENQGLENAQDPVLVTATNLTFDGAVARCSTQLSPGTSDVYVINCAAVQITKGQEAIAIGVEPGLTLDWQQPLLASGSGVTVDSCATSSSKLTQACRVKAPVGASTANIEFALVVSKAGDKPGPGIQRISKDIVSVPWVVYPIGNVPEVPQIAGSKSPAREMGLLNDLIKGTASFVAGVKNWVLGPVSKPAIDFALAADAQIVSCDNKLFVTTRSKIFAIEGTTITHVAGSSNFRNKEDLSNPLRAYWGRLQSIGCAGNQIVFATESPAAIYKLSPARWALTKIVSQNTDSSFPWTGRSVGAQIRLENPLNVTGDRLGNIYYIDMDHIRQIDISGAVTTVYDGTTEMTGLYGQDVLAPALPQATSLALDVDPKGLVRGFFALVYEPTMASSKLVVYIDYATKKIQVVAGRAEEIPVNSRDNVSATSLVLANATGIYSYQDLDGKPVLLISEPAQDGAGAGEILRVNASGLTKVVYSGASIQSATGNLETTLGNGITQIAYVNNQLYLKAMLSNSFETRYAIVKLSAPKVAQVIAGKLPASRDPYLGTSNALASIPAISNEELELGRSISAYGSDGSLYIADNKSQRFFKQLPGDQTLKVIASTQAGTLQSMKFSGQVLALAVHKGATGPEKLVYIEEGENRSIKTWTIGQSHPVVIANAPVCDLLAARVSCDPTQLAIDSTGRVYFFDSGSRTVRRITAPGKFETVAGTGAANLGKIGRHTGAIQKAGNMGFSSIVTGMAFDRAGNLIVSDSGSASECPWGLCAGDGSASGQAGTFLPFIVKIAPATTLSTADVTTIVGAGGTSVPRFTSAQMMLNQKIAAASYMPFAPFGAAILPEGAVMFEDQGILMIAKPSGTSYLVSRFFGGENQDCGFSVVSGNSSNISLGNALGRMCAGKVLSLASFDPCKGAPQATASIAIGQMLAREYNGSDGGGSVLKLEIQCQSVPNAIK
jgi:hypothetical protein